MKEWHGAWVTQYMNEENARRTRAARWVSDRTRSLAAWLHDGMIQWAGCERLGNGWLRGWKKEEKRTVHKKIEYRISGKSVSIELRNYSSVKEGETAMDQRFYATLLDAPFDIKMRTGA